MSTMNFVIKTSNGRFFQLHHVRAASQEMAEALAKADADKSLPDERAHAAQMGLPTDAVRPYGVCSVEQLETDDDDAPAVRFVDSGGEG